MTCGSDPILIHVQILKLYFLLCHCLPSEGLFILIDFVDMYFLKIEDLIKHKTGHKMTTNIQWAMKIP